MVGRCAKSLVTMSGRLWQQGRRTRSLLLLWPSRKPMKRVRERVRQLTLRWRGHRDVRGVIAATKPVLPGWRSACARAQQPTTLSTRRATCSHASKACCERSRRSVTPGQVRRGDRPIRKLWASSPVWGDPLPRPTPCNGRVAQMLRADRPSVSRVREIRTLGLRRGVGSKPDLRVS